VSTEPEWPCHIMPTRECLGICNVTGYCFRFDEPLDTDENGDREYISQLPEGWLRGGRRNTGS
jgi:hypothetical protein